MQNCAGRAQLDPQQAQARDGKRLPAVSTATRTRELAHAGLTMFNVENTSIWEKDRRQHQDQVNVWIAWLDWEVRFVRLSWEANVTTWNLGPLGYEYSRSNCSNCYEEASSCNGARSRC